MTGEEYKKESDGKTYLLLEKKSDTFEEQMIQRARPTGVLPMVRSERTDVYKYEITGKKNLAMTFERVPMNAEQVEKVLRGILDVLGRGREYLLSEDCFVLSPEHIYLRIPEYEVTLCYYPDYEVPFAEQLGKLFEVLLNRVDYREERAIAMVYALYMQLQEPDMTLERIQEILKEQAESPVYPVLQQKDGLHQSLEEVKPRGVSTEAIPGNKRSPKSEEKIIPETKTAHKSGWWGRLRKEMSGIRFLRGEDAKETYIPAALPCVREREPEWEPQYTRVLSVKKEETGPALISQRNGETIFLTKFPFYVGSLSGYMDYVIRKDTVSRFHAKFIKQGRSIVLSDLNSTNGTKINGRVLEVREQAVLVNGDRILFADEEYVYFEKGE